MSDNEDLLGDDLGDHSFADYNLGNEEEEKLLADDDGPSQNVPTSIGSFHESVDPVPTEFPRQNVEYNLPLQSYTQPETECVVPNITVEVPNIPAEPCSYTPFNESYEERTVPPAIPAAPIESPQIVPSEMTVPIDAENNREIVSERSLPQRSPLPRNIPDSLDKVFVPRAGFNKGGARSWRNPQYRQNHPYRRNNYSFRGNFNQRPSFPPPQMRPQIPNPQIRPDLPELRPEFTPMGPEISPERPIIPPDQMDRFNQRFPYRDDFNPNIRPNFERPMFFQRSYNPRFTPNDVTLPQVIRQPLVLPALPKREPEVRMLPVLNPLPTLPPGVTAKKVLINPHFKGTFQPPVEGPIKDIDDAAERFIAEQRNALARAANRKLPRRSPTRYIENTTIEIENELARAPPRRRSEEDDLLRRQEEFINANRAGLRRRMRSPSPVRRSPSPRRSPERRPRPLDEESEYRRRVREQENLRERVLRAKEVRRRKNAVALQKHLLDKEKEKNMAQTQKEETKSPELKENKPTNVNINTVEEQEKPDTTRKTPEREKIERMERERSPVKVESAEANSTCDNLTPPRENIPKTSPERNLTPPLPKEDKQIDSDDDLDLILDDIDDILSDDDDSGRFKEKPKKVEEPPKKQVDLRSKLPPKAVEPKKPKQKIVFNDHIEEKKKKEKSPIRRTVLGTNKHVNNEKTEANTEKILPKVEVTNASAIKSRQKIIFDNKEVEKEKDKDKLKAEDKKFPNRRVILQRKVPEKSVFSRIETTDPTKPNPGIFSRAVRTAIRIPEKSRIVIKNAQIDYQSDSDDNILDQEVGFVAEVTNLPFGMTDTRMKTLAGQDVQNLILDKEERSAKITFKTTIAAENFKKKFNNKMVAASRLTVCLK
ncbi:unnamed protein product, partial [Brenthis ino]